MTEEREQFELTAEQKLALGNVQDKCEFLYGQVVTIIAETVAAVQSATSQKEGFSAIRKMLDRTEEAYRQTLNRTASQEKVISQTRELIAGLATRLMLRIHPHVSGIHPVVKAAA